MAGRLVRAALLLVSSAIPCCGADRVMVGKTWLAGSTDPTSGSTPWSLTSHGIAEKLFTVDESGNVVGQIAESIMKLSTFSWEVQLKADYNFSDGTPVTAANVATALALQNQDNPSAQSSVGAMTFSATGDLKLTVGSERATPVMDAVLAEWPFVVSLQKDGGFIFTGPYAVETFAAERIDLVPNMYYPQASARPKATIKKFLNGDSLATAMGNGELDLAFHLPVDKLQNLRDQGITIKSFLVGYHYMMFYNMLRPALSDVRVRKAIDRAINRQALSQELRGGRATMSLFPETTPYHLQVPGALAFPDTDEAEGLLNDAGWVKNNDGIREKDGVLLSLDLVAYPQRPGLVTMQPLIAASLTALGIQVNSIVTSDDNPLGTITDNRDFDLLMWAQHTLPAGDPQWFLNAFFRSDSSSRNYAGLNVTAIDDLLDALAVAEAPQDRVDATTAAHNAVLAKVPISNLLTPEWHVGLSDRLSSYTPWGSDYYVIRADFGLGCCNETSDDDGDEADGAPRVAPHAIPALAAILFLSCVL